MRYDENDSFESIHSLLSIAIIERDIYKASFIKFLIVYCF